MTSSLIAVWYWLKRVFPFKTLRSRFILGFIVGSVLAISNILVVQSLLQQNDTIAATVNIAGKMRMLSQRIGFTQLAARDLKTTKSDVAENSEAALQAYKADFESALGVLRNGGTAFGLTVPAVTAAVQERLDKIEVSWDSYRRAQAAMGTGTFGSAELDNTTTYSSDVVIELIASSEWLLNNTEALTDSLVQQAQAMQAHVMRQMYGLFIMNALMLLLAWTIISFKVLKPIQRLIHLSNELIAGNYNVRLHLKSNDEFGALSSVLNKSSSHIKQLLHDLDIKQTVLKQAEVKLRRAALVYQHISEAVVVTDANGYAQDVNPAFSLTTGYSSDEIIGNCMNKLSSGHHPSDFFRVLWNSLESTGRWRGDIWNKRKSGENFVSHLMITTCFNDDGSVNCRIGLFSDVTERRKQEALIWRQSRFDHLTQLPNRQMFHENLQSSIDQSRRSGLPFALIFLDLDFFKEVNDTFGHDEGDALLQQVAQRISGCCRNSDQVARLGGDEFIMVAQDLKQPHDVHRICREILNAIANPYKLLVNEVRISCSVGVTFFPNDTEDAAELLKFADLAMYAAKDKGRNQYCLFSTAMRDSVELRHELLRDLQYGLDTEQFVLHYQPIIDLQSGRVVKAEALVRWVHPERGLVSPADFIPLAEDSGMIVPLGESVFRQAAQQVSLWRRSLNKEFTVTVNVSPAQFQSDGLNPRYWVEALHELGLPGSAIGVEITEGLLMEINEDAHEKLREFRRAGIQIALDDFGTGYSSLSYLRRFNIDVIKIDQSFVRDLTESSENMALCKAIITMAHQLGLDVVAEGIECRQQHDLLRAAGCDYGQGYLYSKPVSADQFTDWLKSHDS